MQIKTILNRVQKYQSFIYTDIELKEQDNQLEMEIAILPRGNSRPVCSQCGRKGSVSFGPGDLVIFPEGLECNWNVKKAVKKYYNFG